MEAIFTYTYIHKISCINLNNYTSKSIQRYFNRYTFFVQERVKDNSNTFCILRNYGENKKLLFKLDIDESLLVLFVAAYFNLNFYPISFNFYQIKDSLFTSNVRMLIFF